MTGKTQLEVLEYLESAGEVSSQTVALVLNLERHRATQVLLDLAASADKQAYCIVPLQRPGSEL